MEAFFSADRIEVITRIFALLFLGVPLTFIVSKWLRKVCSQRFSPQQGMIVGKFFLYSVLTVIFVTLIYELGFSLTPLLGTAGIVGIAVGFASQTSISNIISGFFLIIEKPFEVGDVVNVGATTGAVLSVDFLSIKLRTFDNQFVRIPNEVLIKSEITNVTRFPIRRADIKVSVAYKEDLEKVKTLLNEIAYNNPLCLQEPEPLILFLGFNASSIDLQFSVWSERTEFLKLKNTIQEEIKSRFDRENIEIPFPHVSLYSGKMTEPFPIRILKEESNDHLVEKT